MTSKIIKLKPGFTGTAGNVGFFTWARLEKLLQKAGQLREGESIEGYRVEEAGVNFYITKEKKDGS